MTLGDFTPTTTYRQTASTSARGGGGLPIPQPTGGGGGFPVPEQTGGNLPWPGGTVGDAGPATPPSQRSNPWFQNAINSAMGMAGSPYQPSMSSGQYGNAFNAAFGWLLGQPQNATAMGGFGNSLMSNLFAQQLAGSNYGHGVNQAYGGHNLALQSLGLDQAGINYNLGNIDRDRQFINNDRGFVDRLRALLGRDFSNTVGDINRQAATDKRKTENTYAARGAHFAPEQGLTLADIEAGRKSGITAADIARDRGNVSLDERLNGINQQLANLNDRAFDLNQAASQLGIDRQRLDLGLNDTLRQLGLDQFLTLSDLEADRSNMSSEQAAFYNSLLQLAFQNVAQNPDYWVDAGTPTSVQYQRPVRPIR